MKSKIANDQDFTVNVTTSDRSVYLSINNSSNKNLKNSKDVGRRKPIKYSLVSNLSKLEYFVSCCQSINSLHLNSSCDKSLIEEVESCRNEESSNEIISNLY